jgi:hypothetical protein
MDTKTTPKKDGAKRNREFIVVYGPPCSGKTLNAAAMCAKLGYDAAFDADETEAIRQAKGRIILFAHGEQVRSPDAPAGNRHLYVLRKKPIEAVKRLLGDAWVEPVASR